jgi:hypothetical protein
MFNVHDPTGGSNGFNDFRGVSNGMNAERARLTQMGALVLAAMCRDDEDAFTTMMQELALPLERRAGAWVSSCLWTDFHEEHPRTAIWQNFP